MIYELTTCLIGPIYFCILVFTTKISLDATYVGILCHYYLWRILESDSCYGCVFGPSFIVVYELTTVPSILHAFSLLHLSGLLKEYEGLFVSANDKRATRFRERSSAAAFQNRGSPVHFFQLHNTGDSQLCVCCGTFGRVIPLIPLKLHHEREKRDSKQGLRH